MITRDQALNIYNTLFTEAQQLDLPPWVTGSLPLHIACTAKTAEQIAKLAGMDSDRAFSMGLLHDAGKIEEVRHQRFHGLVGYEMLKDLDPEVARICLTHMFMNNSTAEVIATKRLFYGKQQDFDFVYNYIASTPANDYDLLIQLSDCMTHAGNLVTIEYRIAEYNDRHHLGMSEAEMQRKINLRLEIKKYFEQKIGRDIYEFLQVKK